MSYRVLEKRKIYVPPANVTQRNFARESIEFIRDCCENLQFDPKREDLEDSDGVDGVPYNFERDVDRLCFEKAVSRFVETGAREDAFDIYFCYCEIFKPFGSGYFSTRVLLEMLSEHEENSSSLLMKHRDHYSHSVYVFLLGLAIYKNNAKIRSAYNDRYGFHEGFEACNHFLQFWGLTSLFHDIGYPFEIAHQQMKVYACSLNGLTGGEIDRVSEFSPFVSYKNMDEFAKLYDNDGRINEKDANRIFAEAIADRIGGIYGTDADSLYELLKDRAVNDCLTDSRGNNKYLYMDHAYFSGLILLKKYCYGRKTGTDVPPEVMDAFTAVILHNSLFKFGIRGGQRGLKLSDGQPLAYLLMLCDELQCWDRKSYGHNSRRGIFPFDFDILFADDRMVWNYCFDQSDAKVIESAKVYKSMQCSDGKYKFAEDINEITVLESEVEINTLIIPKRKKSGKYLSDTTYLNLYDFALALNGRYNQSIDMDKTDLDSEEVKCRLMKDFDKLSLEFKLSNIAQAKAFARQLEAIGCFYTNRAVEYERLVNFTDQELLKIAFLEHDRWCDEKAAMGWTYGTGYVKTDGKDDRRMRALTRKHKDMVDFYELNTEAVLKDSEPMRFMIKLLRVFDGLNIYRM